MEKAASLMRAALLRASEGETSVRTGICAEFGMMRVKSNSSHLTSAVHLAAPQE